MSYLCHHYIHKGNDDLKVCGKKISRTDPEKKFCSSHRVCDFVKSHKEKEKEKKIIIDVKYLDYITFSASLIL